MNNYNKIISNMEVKIKNFSKKISKGINSKKKRDFVFEMIYGLIASSSCHLSEIGRSLNERISLKALEKRLSRNLDEFNNGKEIESTHEEVRNKVLFENYEDEIKNKIDENTVFCFDPGDLTKKWTSKFEGIDVIKDGSTGEYNPGYHMIEVAGLSKNEGLPIPVYTRLFSAKEEGFVSTNEEYLKAIEYLGEKYEKRGIYALDRGFDDKKYFEKFASLGLNFVIRMKKNRDVSNAESGIVENIKKKSKRVKMKWSYKYKNKKGITRTAYTGYMKIKIPDLENTTFYLVVIKSEDYPNDPMMLLTNMIPENEEFTKVINKVYIRRWKIEEYFRFKKQQFGFEKELVRSLNSIRTLNVLLTIVIGFIGMFSDKQKDIQYLVVFEASESLRKNKDIVLVFYAIERGMKKIFSYNFNGIKNKKEKGRKPIDLQLSLF